MIRIVIADDQPLVRSGLRSILDREPDLDVVAEVSNGLDAVGAARRWSPDVVLMDLRMPTMDGLTATERILAAPGPAPRIVILTTFDIEEYIHAGLKAGACGFILKDTEPEALVRAVRSAYDAEIGGRLHLSEATVKTRVTAILAKLGVRDRLQAVVAAYESGAVHPGG